MSCRESKRSRVRAPAAHSQGRRAAACRTGSPVGCRPPPPWPEPGKGTDPGLDLCVQLEVHPGPLREEGCRPDTTPKRGIVRLTRSTIARTLRWLTRIERQWLTARSRRIEHHEHRSACEELARVQWRAKLRAPSVSSSQLTRKGTGYGYARLSRRCRKVSRHATGGREPEKGRRATACSEK